VPKKYFNVEVVSESSLPDGSAELVIKRLRRAKGKQPPFTPEPTHKFIFNPDACASQVEAVKTFNEGVEYLASITASEQKESLISLHRNPPDLGMFAAFYVMDHEGLDIPPTVTIDGPALRMLCWRYWTFTRPGIPIEHKVWKRGKPWYRQNR